MKPSADSTLFALPAGFDLHPAFRDRLRRTADDLAEQVNAGDLSAADAALKWKREVRQTVSDEGELSELEIPRLYRSATEQGARDPEAFREVMAYAFDLWDDDENPIRDHKRGLVLYGPSGSGKSCAAYRRMIEEVANGNPWTHVSAVELAETVRELSLRDVGTLHFRLRMLKARATDDDPESQRWFGWAGLLLDDIHQAKLTPTYAQALFSIIEARTSDQSGLIVTSQLTGDALLDRLTSDAPALRDTAIAIVRRIADHCHPVEFRSATRHNLGESL